MLLPYIIGVQGGETTTAEQRDLIDEVHYAIEDLVELIKTYQSMNRLSKVLMSTSFKRRQNDLEAAIDRALSRLQVSDGDVVVGLFNLALGDNLNVHSPKKHRC